MMGIEKKMMSSHVYISRLFTRSHTQKKMMMQTHWLWEKRGEPIKSLPQNNAINGSKPCSTKKASCITTSHKLIAVFCFKNGHHWRALFSNGFLFFLLWTSQFTSKTNSSLLIPFSLNDIDHFSSTRLLSSAIISNGAAQNWPSRVLYLFFYNHLHSGVSF